MQKRHLILCLLFSVIGFAQQADFKEIDFSKADYIAEKVKVKRLYNLNKLTFNLTQNLPTDVEKVRAIYMWICTNIANDFHLFALNDRKRNKYAQDSIKLVNWNSKFKKKLFKKLLKRKKTICTGYAYLFKEMCNFAGIESKMVNGFGRTSAVDFSKLTMPNHTWNIVKLRNKWYLCDPTWSAGISLPQNGKFQFSYNNGYFLTEPKLFFQNHFPLKKEYALLGSKTPSFKTFTELPLLYGDAFKYIKTSPFPLKMYHQIKRDTIISFKYLLKENSTPKKIKFIVNNGNSNIEAKPATISLKKNELTLQHLFTKKGYFDLHLFFDDKIIATYIFDVKK
ncbi:transglutaminase domain-containing protein [uncultured Polaribacter sp.]|uniref:transglutaminase domain-containing protein n=1 Tax=uncultured Polaribacter sp. TaxID=174711 RepID=UPI00261C0150|nr:transglutaminase domain-containing protein [uncultured Polaribacter sp.]